MESIDVFYRIFHEDLNPLTSQKSKEYYCTTINSLLGKENVLDINEDFIKLRFQFYTKLLENTAQQVKRELHRNVYVLHLEEEKVLTMVRNHQSLLLTYCRMVERNYLSSEDDLLKFQVSSEASVTDIFKVVYHTMDNLLDYLDQFFYKYLDHSLPVSHQKRLWFIYTHKKLAEIIISKLMACNIPEEAKMVIIGPLVSVRDNMLTTLTYRQKLYMGTFIKVLKKLLKKQPNPSLESLFKILISLEYNTFNLFFYIERHFKKELDGRTPREQLLQLYLLKKSVVTVSVTSTEKYNPELPSLKERLLVWLEEEIKLTKRKYELAKSETISSPLVAKKKHLDVSISELSLITRLLFESELLTGSKKRVFEFLSSSFTTKTTKDISVESLSSRYYSVNNGTIDAVSKMLRDMLYRLDHLEET